MSKNGNKQTKFASAERASAAEVMRQKENIEASDFLDAVMARTPFMFFILNDQRQVVYSNHMLMGHLGFDEMNDMVGARTGELFRCIHSDEEPGGCGTSENCRYCGAVQAVLESKKQDDLVIRDCRLTLDIDGKMVPAIYEVSSKPFTWIKDNYFIVTLEDRSANLRKEQLEKTFFHDIRNKAGTVQGFLNLIRNKQHEDNSQFLDLATKGIKELLEDIEYQDILIRAESGDLKMNKTAISVQDMLTSVLREYHVMAMHRDIQLQSDFKEDDVLVKTDSVLLKRVLANLIKNAIEASVEGDTINITYTTDNDTVDLVVQNPAVMKEETRLQVFKKSFSTKGEGRGIGTYSIKLFTEEYLDGKVSFTSEAPHGTEFRITLPLEK